MMLGGTGTSGAPIRLTANFFHIQTPPQWVLYQYHVDFDPPMEARRLRAALLFQHEETLGSARTFDGALLFLPLRLPNNETVLHSETRNGETVQITVTLTNELPPSSPVCIQVYNIIFRRIFKILDMQQIGRNFDNPNDPVNIPQHGLTIWPGYTSTILHCETSIMLCTDVSHKVLRNETVLDFMDNMREKVGNQRFCELCVKKLVGLIVLTKYNNKTYRIDDISWDHTPDNTFTKGDTDISLKEYYKTQYNLDIADCNQALLVSHVKKMGPSEGPSEGPPPGPAMLIPELCFLTGLTDEMRADDTIMEDVSTHTKLEPDVREGRLTRFVSNIHENTDAQAELDKWRLGFDQELLNLTGRVLPAERILQGPRTDNFNLTQYDYNPNSADWSKEMRGRPLISPIFLDNWVMLYTKPNEGVAQSLLQTLIRVAGPLDIHMERAIMIEYNDHRKSLLRALENNVGPQTQMVVVVLSSKNKEMYDSVKTYLCVDCPTPSQCVVASTISGQKSDEDLETVVTNIALQIACKMGGQLWRVEVPLEWLMIVGIACCHDTMSGLMSARALVANLNQDMSRWYSKCVYQVKEENIMDGLNPALYAALKAYQKVNHHLPSHIIVYRDGVGDGQLHSDVNDEVAQIMESIKYMEWDYEPKLSVVVVKKHINSRFFSKIHGKVLNPPPGTIVDSEVTHPEWYDFYIVSQAVRMGSASPTHYNVVYDTSELNPDHMQRLTYKLCHMYYNWQGTIRVPAPCQYAHKLAFLVGQSIHEEPNMKLDNLFYL